jgi:hypothetical protein
VRQLIGLRRFAEKARADREAGQTAVQKPSLSAAQNQACAFCAACFLTLFEDLKANGNLSWRL